MADLSRCREECADLLLVADDFEAAAPGIGPVLAPLRSELERLADDPELETVAGERRLEQLTEELRRAWTHAAHAAADAPWRSPPHRTTTRLAGGQTTEYTYERALRPTVLEDRLALLRGAPAGWEEDHLVFASGMATVSACLQAYLRLARPTATDPARLAFCGGYFETSIVLDLMGSAIFTPFRPSHDQLLQAIVDGACDALLLEPVAYDGDLTVLDLDAVGQAWRARRSRRPGALFLDTTLGAGLPRAADLPAALGAVLPPVVAILGSGSKLEQQGLELSNLGLLSLYTPPGESPNAPEIGRYLRTLRTSLNLGLSVEAASLLAPRFVLDPELFALHSERVFAANERAAAALAGDGSPFRRVVHPSLGPLADRPWSRAPFVVLELEDNPLDRQRQFVSAVEAEADGRGIPLTVGSSFGFRGHRTEVIVVEEATGSGILKIAFGARGGPSADAIVELVRSVAARQRRRTRVARPTAASRALWRETRLALPGGHGNHRQPTRVEIFARFDEIPPEVLEALERAYVDVFREPPWSYEPSLEAVGWKLQADIARERGFVGILTDGTPTGVQGFCWGGVVDAAEIPARVLDGSTLGEADRPELERIAAGLGVDRAMYGNEIAVLERARGTTRSLEAFVELSRELLRPGAEEGVGLFNWTLASAPSFRILNRSYQFTVVGAFGDMRMLWAPPEHVADLSAVLDGLDFRGVCRVFRLTARELAET